MSRRTSLLARWAAWKKQCRKALAAKKCDELLALASRESGRHRFRVDMRRPASKIPMYKRAGKQLRGYGSASAEHRKRAVVSVNMLRQHLHTLKREIRDGDCRNAADTLVWVAENAGAANSEIKGMSMTHGGGPLVRRRVIIRKTLNKAVSLYKQGCVKTQR